MRTGWILFGIMALILGASGSELTVAIRDGQIQKARDLVKARPELVSVRHGEGFRMMPLAYAAAQGEPELVEELIKAGAEVEQVDTAGGAPWLLAERVSDAIRNRDGHTAGYVQSRYPWIDLDSVDMEKVIKCWGILRGRALDQREAVENGLLFAAIRAKDLAAVKEALAQGTPAESIGKARRNAIYLAVELGQEEIAKELAARNADPYLFHETAGACAYTIASPELQAWLRKSSPKPEWRLFPRIDALGSERPSPKIAALGSELTVAIRDGQIEKAKDLVKANPALVNVRHDDRYRMLPLAYAAARGEVELVEELLAAGAEVDLYDARERPTWHVAELTWRALRRPDNAEQSDIRTKHPWVPFDTVKGERVMRCAGLLKERARKQGEQVDKGPLFAAIRAKDLAAVKEALAAGAPGESIGTDCNAIFLAVELGQEEIARELAKAGADPYRYGFGKETYAQCAFILASPELRAWLLEHHPKPAWKVLPDTR